MSRPDGTPPARERRMTMPVNRLNYGELGNPTSTTRTLGMSSAAQPPPGPTSRNRYLELPKEAILEQIKQNEDWKAAAQRCLIENEGLEKKFADQDREQFTAEELEVWDSVKPHVSAARQLIPGATENLKLLKEALKVVQDKERAQAATPTGLRNRSRPVTTSSAASRSKQVEIKARRESLKVREIWQEERKKLTKSIRDLEMDLKQILDDGEKTRISDEIAHLRETVKEGDEEVKMKLEFIKEREDIDKDEIAVEVEEEQDIDEEFDDASAGRVSAWLDNQAPPSFYQSPGPGVFYQDLVGGRTPVTRRREVAVRQAVPAGDNGGNALMNFNPLAAVFRTQTAEAEPTGVNPPPPGLTGLGTPETQPVVTQPTTPSPTADMTQFATIFSKTLAEAFQDSTRTKKDWDRDLPIFNGKAEDWPVFNSEFERTTPPGKVNSSQSLIRLRKALKGSAKDAVVGLLNEPKNVSTILKTLEQRFGRPDIVLTALASKAEHCKSPEFGKPETFVAYGSVVQFLIQTAKSINETVYLNDVMLLRRLVQKLPALYQEEWMQWLKIKVGKPKNLESFGDWIEEKIETWSMLVIPVIKDKDTEKQQRGTRGSAKINVATTETSSSPKASTSGENTDAKCLCCGVKHKIWRCYKFRKLSFEDKQKFVQENRLCYRCLDGGHMKKDCPSDRVCGKDDCKATHHKLLHTEEKFWQRKERQKENRPAREARTSESSEDTDENKTQSPGSDRPPARMNWLRNKPSKPMSVVKVKVRGPLGVRKVYYLCDSGCDSTAIEEEICQEVGITARPVDAKCQGVGGIEIQLTGDSAAFEVSGVWKNAPFYKVDNVITLTDLGLDRYTQSPAVLKAKYAYLRKAKLEAFDNVRIQMIIGEDHPFLTAHREILERRQDEPMAKRLKLGWVLAGKRVVEAQGGSKINALTFTEDEQLDNLLRKCFSLESYGVYPKVTEGSVEDKKALQIFEDTLKLTGTQWEIGLPYRDDNVVFPPSRNEAVRRLLSNEKRMEKNPSYYDLYHGELDKYVSRGYVRELTAEEAAVVTGKTFYISHFGVFNVNKPGKLRLVFDAASSNSGTSLNANLMTGPDLIRPLASVLMNFRRHNYAINGDIEEMFHRVAVRQEDRVSQRFVWRDLREKIPVIRDFEMTVLIFGASSSPSSAIYVKNVNAARFSEKYPEAARATEEDFYCDDCLSGSQTIQGAIDLRRRITEINAAGNFFVKKWLSNSREVIASVPEEDRAKGVKSFGENTEIPLERILGLWWKPEEDHFTFSADFKKVKPELLEGRRPTKRQMCGLLMSVFDPLGFIANFKVKGLILLQRTWRSGVDWDDEIPDSVFEEWQVWVQNLQDVEKVKIPRCYAYDLHLATKVQLHTMMDASEEATCAICFLRITMGECTTVTIVCAKAKVAPIKKLTIPRLELVAATMGATLANTVAEDLKVTIHSRHFWTDSRTVLMWIRAETLRYKEFVANRVNRIHLRTSVSDWRWVPTDLNVADQGTRLKSKIELCPESAWITGPAFLYEPEDSWPIEQLQVPEADDTAEVKKKCYVALFHGGTPDVTSDTVQIERFSDFGRMVRAQACVIRVLRYWARKVLNQPDAQPPWNLKDKDKLRVAFEKGKQACFLNENLVTKLEPEDLEEAELWLAKKVQQESFTEEIAALEKGDRMKGCNKVQKLSPVLEDGILRAKGRLQAAAVSKEVKTPIILPTRHHFVELLVLKEHQRNGHQGLDTVLNQCRGRYWIVDGRRAVQRAVEQCQICRIGKAQPILPCMGDLPYYRLDAGNPPFTHTGVDLMGPVEVVVGRHHEKRWVIVFTCMVTRAVSLDIVYGLSTDETLLALSRFVDQKGRPRHLYSDNGTNFVGASNELKSCWGNVSWPEVMQRDKFQAIKWHFNPPHLPHFGGAWERMVQSVKKILKKTLNDKFPKDQTLLTMLKGAENIINSRPLSYTSKDTADPDPLTPNHFLRGFSDIGPSIPGEYEPADEVLRAQWRKAQYFLEVFWSRWTKEVMPELAKREKWHLEAEPLEVGAIVLLADDQAPRNVWKKAVVTEVYPGSDGQVRVVQVKTADGKTWKRGVHRICPLGLKMGNQGVNPDLGVGMSANKDRENKDRKIPATSTSDLIGQRLESSKEDSVQGGDFELGRRREENQV